ncbi:MAG: PIN domain-containing protein [Thermoprotei archaeon]|nr:MAG: PIN domain-containing protein [Thermoprotei archaeon]
MENIERKIWDVNILAIYLVEDHPGHEYVSPIVEEGLRGAYIPVLLDILPIRAYWILEKKWKIDKKKAALAVSDFLKKYNIPEYVPVKKETILEAFRLSEKLRHDVYDCIYLALAKQENASTIITTDTDFQKLCQKTELKYENPIPPKILKQFQNYRHENPNY